MHRQRREPQVGLDACQEPPGIEQLALLIMRFADAVGVEHQQIAGRNFDRPGLPSGLGGDADRYAGVVKLLRRGAVVCPDQIGRVVAGVAVGQRSGTRIEDAIESGYEHVRAGIGQDALVRRVQHLLGPVGVFEGIGANQGAAQSHKQRRAGAFVGHIGDQDAQAPVGQLHQIVKVARRLPGRPQRGRQLPAVDVWQGGGQKAGLDLGRHGQFLGYFLMRQRPGVLLRPVERRGDLCRQRLQGR